MTKNFLQHDYFSRTSPVLLKIRAKHGMAGIGVYWCLTEKIHECNGFIDYDLELLTYELGTTPEIINDVVSIAYEIVDNQITAEWVVEDLSERDKTRKAKSEAGKASGEARRNPNKLNKLKASVKQVFNSNTTDVKHMLGNNATDVEEVKLREVKLSKVMLREAKPSQVMLNEDIFQPIDTSSKSFNEKADEEFDRLFKLD
jgi:hypothetical protein